MSKETKTGRDPATRRWGAVLLLAVLALFSGMALSIPYVYESQTLWYKLGYEKTMLRSGQLAGLAAVISLLVQILLGVRGRLLEVVFGVPRLLRWHRRNGLIIASFAIIHITLVLLAEEIPNLFGAKARPELVGALLITIVMVMVITSSFRRQLGLAYARWLFMHRLLACSVPVLLAAHVLFVSDSFAGGVPRIGLLIVLTILIVTVLRIKWTAGRKGGG